MFKSSKEEEASLPPAYSPSGPSSLIDSSHGVSLAVNNGTFLPGSNVEADLAIPADVLSSMQGDIQCSFEGKSSVEIMGKERYQKAQMLNAGMGGNAVPISGREEHLFAVERVTVSPTSQGKIDSGSSTSIPISLRIPTRRTCNCPGEEDGIMPSLGWKGSIGERNRVTWKLKVVFGRKGMLKRDIKLSIEIPVSLTPQEPRKAPLVASDSKNLSYDSSLSSTPPRLELNLSVFPSSAGTPLRIPFQLTLTSIPHPELLDLSDPTLKISVGLCKHTWTKGIDTSLGSKEGHDFPGIMVGSLKVDDNRPEEGPGFIRVMDDGKDKGDVIVEGEYEVEEDMSSARGCGLRLSWSLQAQVRWKKLGGPIVVAQAIHLPHYTTP